MAQTVVTAARDVNVPTLIADRRTPKAALSAQNSGASLQGKPPRLGWDLP